MGWLFVCPKPHIPHGFLALKMNLQQIFRNNCNAICSLPLCYSSQIYKTAGKKQPTICEPLFCQIIWFVYVLWSGNGLVLVRSLGIEDQCSSNEEK